MKPGGIKPFVVWEIGGANPVYGDGMTHDLHHWHWRSLGTTWSFVISRAVIPPKRRSRGCMFTGDAVGVYNAKADGWGMRGVYPEDRLSLRRLRAKNPASFMATAEVMHFVNRCMSLYERGELLKMGPWSKAKAITFKRVPNHWAKAAYTVYEGNYKIGVVHAEYNGWSNGIDPTIYRSKMLAAEALR